MINHTIRWAYSLGVLASAIAPIRPAPCTVAAWDMSGGDMPHAV